METVFSSRVKSQAETDAACYSCKEQHHTHRQSRGLWELSWTRRIVLLYAARPLLSRLLHTVWGAPHFLQGVLCEVNRVKRMTQLNVQQQVMAETAIGIKNKKSGFDRFRCISCPVIITEKRGAQSTVELRVSSLASPILWLIDYQQR